MKLYCSMVCTQAIRCLLMLSTISNTDNLLVFLAHLKASIIVPKVPVLPIPALQWIKNSYLFSIIFKQSYTRFLNSPSPFSPIGFFMSPHPVHCFTPFLREYAIPSCLPRVLWGWSGCGCSQGLLFLIIGTAPLVSVVHNSWTSPPRASIFLLAAKLATLTPLRGSSKAQSMTILRIWWW